MDSIAPSSFSISTRPFATCHQEAFHINRSIRGHLIGAHMRGMPDVRRNLRVRNVDERTSKNENVALVLDERVQKVRQRLVLEIVRAAEWTYTSTRSNDEAQVSPRATCFTNDAPDASVMRVGLLVLEPSGP